MRSTELPGPIRCPQCSYEMTDASGVGHNERPSPGDWTVCIRCAAVLRFTEEIGVREASGKELAELDPESALAIAQAVHAIRQMRHGMN